MTQRSRPVTADPEPITRLRAALEGWTVDSVTDLLGERAMRALDRENFAPALLEARAAARDGDERPTTLTRLWLVGDTVTVHEIEAAVPGMTAAELAHMGLIDAAGSGRDDPVRARVDLRPYSALAADGEHHWWVASDLGESVTHAALAPDYVLGVGGASTTLAGLTVREPVSRTLDLGTGCGIQALHAAAHSDSVVATDISPRALSFAGFNAALNGVADRVDLREGSMLEPVRSEQFDLVVSNPPFVISPPGTPRYEYRSGDLAGDGLVRSLVESVGHVLAPDGIAQFLGNWEIHSGKPWQERLEGWLQQTADAGAALDAWVIQRDVLDPAEYAHTWLRDAGLTPERDHEAHLAATEAYLRDFDARGVEAVGLGVVLLRRAAGTPTLRRLEEFETPLPPGSGSTIAAVLRAHDWLESTSDQQLLDTALTVAGDVTDERYARPGSPDPEHILLRQGGGLGRTYKADTVLAGLVGACDGELTVGQIAHAMAALVDVDSGELVAGVVPAVRDLVRDGLLVHSDPEVGA